MKTSTKLPNDNDNQIDENPNEERTISVISLTKSKLIFKKKSQSVSQNQLNPIPAVHSGASTGQGDNIKSSPKGFRLNDPKAFRQLFTENREAVDSKPILVSPDHLQNLESGECNTISRENSKDLKDPMLMVLQKNVEDARPVTKYRFSVATQCPSIGVFERESAPMVHLGDNVSQSVPMLNKFALTAPKVSSMGIETTGSYKFDSGSDLTEGKLQEPRAAKSFHRDSKLQRIINKFRRKKES